MKDLDLNPDDKTDEPELSDLPWPKPGDSPFNSETSSWNEIAPIDPSVRGRGFWSRIIGFKRAADLLSMHAVGHRYDINTLALPIVTLYRHYLEIVLKELCKETRRASGRPADFPAHHGLVLIWQEIRDFSIKEFPNEDRESLDAVDAVIREFDGIDPTSMTFRYGVGKRGEQLLPDDFTQINIKNLAEVMNATGRFLESFADMLGDALDLTEQESQY